jgi:hypothetical protein
MGSPRLLGGLSLRIYFDKFFTDKQTLEKTEGAI